MSDVKAKIEAKIAGKKVMVFSKPTCPFCKMAKDVLKTYNLNADEYEVWEIGSDPECDKIQNILSKMTGARTVPRVFINGKCIGGGSETQQLHKSGQLKALLA